MKLTKRQLKEIIDSNDDLIGKDDIPKSGGNLETQASNTTDINAKIGMQPFRYDMLGRFGFTLLPFFEGKDADDVDPNDVPILKDLAKLMYDKYMETLEYYYRNPNKLKSDFRIHSEHDFESQPEDKRKVDFDWAKKVIALIHPYLEDKDVEKKPVDEEISSKKPITFKSRKNDLFYITFKFDDNERLSSVDNKWDIGFPDWWGLEVPETDIINFFRRKYPEFYLVDNSLNEVAVIEDKVVDKKTEDEISKKSDDKGVREKNLQKIAGLINKKFDKKDIDKLINLLERDNG
jgi:hypothetical protein